ncbi:MAG: lanthionine synthetase LanC family protein [Melioribacteraceae bacterium]
MSNKELFLENAYKIGIKICGQALWKEDKCTWQVVVPDRKNYESRKPQFDEAGGGLYQGTAGISVFLTELYKHIPDDLIKKTAVGAANNALAEAKKLPLSSFGFHSGRVGIAYALNKAGDVFSNNEFLDSSREILLEMKGKEALDNGIDVIGGGGGSIPVILQLAEYYNDQNLFEIALALGDNLIKVANRELIGWSWGSNYNTHARHLCGYAHGASGIGHAFLELFNATGSDYYLYPAEQASLYERQFFNKQENNWPDFRHSELGLYYHYETSEQMRARALRNEFQKYSPKYMSAWCHGAPGIGLSRIRAYELLKKEIYKDEAVYAAENTIKSLAVGNANYSLCHGAFGNAETLICAYRVLGNDEYLTKAQEIAVKGIEESQKQNGNWKCGTMNSTSDPSLMLGEAGIGYYLLRLADNNIESVLAPITKRITKQEIVKKENRVLIIDSLKNYLFRTISLLENNEVEKFIFPKADQSTIQSLLETIESFYAEMLGAEKQPQKQKLFDESKAIETKTIGLLKANDDYTADYVYSLTKTDFDLLDKEKTILKLHHLCVPVELGYNWNEFGTDKFPKEEAGSYLLFIQQTKPFLKKLNLLGKLIIDQINNGLTARKLVENVVDNFDIEDEAQKIDLEQKISMQLKEFYRANIIVVDSSPLVFIDDLVDEVHKCDHCEKHGIKL